MSKLVNVAKKSKVIYQFYYYIMTAFINFIKIFIKSDNHLILFVSYGGRHYNDSPKYIYEKMLTDERFANYRLVWAFRDPDNIKVPGRGEKIKIDSLQYYITALKARCWITNVIIERTLNFTGKNTYYFHTTHSCLPKTVGYDAKADTPYDNKYKYKYSTSIAQSEFEAKIEEKAFGMSVEHIKLYGFPKNDCLVNTDDTVRRQIRGNLKIPEDKIAILYAPTFRDSKEYVMKCPIDLYYWREKLRDHYVLLYRVHPTVSHPAIDESLNDFVIDVSSIASTEDVIIDSDMLVSDYSGIIYDYLVTQKPVFSFAYDYDDYIKERELYFDTRKFMLGGSVTEAELINIIRSYNRNDMDESIRKLTQMYTTYFGNATKLCIDDIYSNIKC